MISKQAEAILKECRATGWVWGATPDELPVTALERWQRLARAYVEDLEKRLAVAPGEP